jgi:hypothetical protein
MAVADPRPHGAQQPPVRRPRLGVHGLDEAVHHGADRCRLRKPLHGSTEIVSLQQTAESLKTPDQNRVCVDCVQDVRWCLRTSGRPCSR